MVIRQHIARKQHSGTFARSVESVISAVEAQPATHVNTANAGRFKPICPVYRLSGRERVVVDDWYALSASGCSNGPCISTSLGLHTGTKDISISFSIKSAELAAALMGRLRIATSTPSVVKLALLIDEETRTSTSG